MSFLDKAKELVAKHDEQVDAGLEKLGDQVDQRTGQKYSDHIDRGVDAAQQHTGAGDTHQRVTEDRTP
ncbi:antitoxin [Actinoplanes derwentensis]|uniref:MT0933-like antitoxin protein n=1 Tax=Actinoplanes derwentensis TaxID=113562 RepID=A0A1H2C314_9ACTN|nr:antitoxin [Actinoplanes derwentensis]GID84138.1 hypothetical protein Ade03nite_30620 [Actinoplanes derwentensis]SDT64928.1 MT0933-like antitoxin protein [Actinoplanes derwentensis]